MVLIETLERISKFVPLFLLFVTIIGILIGKLHYGINFLQPLEKIAHEQMEYRRRTSLDLKKTELINLHLRLGNDFLNLGKLEAAKKEFEAALDIDKLNSQADLGLFKARVFDKLPYEDLDYEITNKKIDFITQLAKNKDDPHAYYFKGMLNKDIKPKEAIRWFKLATRSDDQLVDAYFRIGMIYEINEDYPTSEALEFYKHAHEQSPYNQTYLNNLAYQYLQQEQYETAIEHYVELLKIDKNDLLIYITISHAMLYNGNFQESADKMNDFIRILEKNTDILSSKINGMEWYFEGFGTEKILLNTKDKKMCWGYLNSFYKNSICGNLAKANRDLEIAFEFFNAEPTDLNVVIKLMQADIGKFTTKCNISEDILEDTQERFIRRFNQQIDPALSNDKL